MSLFTVLGGMQRLAIDTAPIIYFVEANPRYDTVVSAIFQHIEQGHLTGSPRF